MGVAESESGNSCGSRRAAVRTVHFNISEAVDLPKNFQHRIITFFISTAAAEYYKPQIGSMAVVQ